MGNKLLGNYGKLQKHHLCYLFRSHCCSYYGSQLWNVTSCGFKACCTQWNKAVRHIKGLHYRTHTWILGPVTNQYHISVQLFIKSLRFIYSLFNSNNSIVSYIGKILALDATSPIGKNLSYFRHKFDVSLNDTLKINIGRIVKANSLTESQQSLVNVIEELQNESFTVDGFTNDMCNDMLYDISVC